MTVKRVTIIVEVALFALVLAFLLTGKSGKWIDGFGRRSDLLASIILFVVLVLLDAFVGRQVVPRLERYFSPAPYDEHRILFDLGQEAGRAANVEELYKSIAAGIERSFEAEDVSIFTRDEATGECICRISSSHRIANPVGIDGVVSPVLDEPPLSLSKDAFVIKRLNTLSAPLVIGAGEFATWSQALSFASASVREARQQERRVLESIKAHLLVQIRTKERLIGVLSLGLRRGQFEYSPADREVLMSVASQLALVVENSRLAERMVAEERLRRELILAGEVQRRLLPAKPPEGVAVELAGFCRPARGVGGDYYDFFKFDNQQLGIAIADVAGKGMAAALLMSTVQATLRSLSASENGRGHASGKLGDMVATLNRLLWSSTGGANYVTFFYAQFDQATQRLAYVNAGHNPPFFYRAYPVQDFRTLSSGGLFVGMFEHCAYEQEVVQMQTGDVLIAFTDGLSEAQNADGDEFDEHRIKEVLVATAHLTVNEIRDAIEERVRVWVNTAPQYDDLTFIVMKVN
ncbi:MAG: GAF domain-containing SpoIIE family protein phosphatase [Acidobacteriota bacterium]